jgi:hypothetical protein
MMSKATTKRGKTPDAPVSPNNPCPFLRALVSQGLLPDQGASLGEVTDTIVKVARHGEGEPKLPAGAIRAIALIANGLGPLQLARNATGGLKLNALRDGPLDKHGAGSSILNAQAEVVEAELKRLDSFASDKVDASGATERGMDLKELTRMMDANFERAKGRRRRIDRRLMDGEWPVLLQVMGKPGRNGRYLSLEDVRRLFQERQLPQRMTARITTAGSPPSGT